MVVPSKNKAFTRLSDDLRSDSNLDISKRINKIARKHQTRPVCTLDGF